MMKKLITLLSIFLITGNVLAQGLGNAKTTQSLQFPTTKTIPDDKARIYILRTTGTLSNYSVTIYMDDKIIGKIGPKSYLLFDCDINKEITIATAFIGNNVRNKSEENQEFITINPKSGRTYYIGVKAKFGTFRGQTEITPLESNEAIKLIPKFEKPKVNYIE